MPRKLLIMQKRKKPPTDNKIKYLYNLGDTCNSITGGYDTEDYFKYGGNAHPIFNNDNIYIKTDNTNRSCMLQTNNSFNLSNYEKLCVDIEVINPMYINGPSESSQDWSWLVIGTYSHKIDTDIMDGFTLKQFKLNETKTRQVLKFDISDVNNNGHIAIWSTSSSQATRITDIKIYKIWLEKSDTTTLYLNGDENVILTGGWNTQLTASYGPATTIVKNANNIYLPSGVWNMLLTNNKIDVTNYDVVYMKYSKEYSSYSLHPARCAIKLGNKNTSWDDFANDATTGALIGKDETQNNVTNGILTIDVSNVTGSYYVGVGGQSNNITVYEIGLKKNNNSDTITLYSNGNECIELTGGYLTSSNSSATCNIEKQADNLYVNCAGKQSFDSICYARTNKTIKPCKIKVSVINNYISANGVAFCMFLSEKEAITSVSDFNSVVNKKYIKASNTIQGQYIDLEIDLTGSTEGYFYIACMVAGSADYICKANIRKIEITKVNKFLNNYYGYLLIAGLCNATGIALTSNTANVFVNDVIDTIGNTLEPFVSYREYNNNYYLRLDDIVISTFIDFANSNKSKYGINLNFTSLNEYKAHYGSGRPTDIVVPGSEQDIDWKTNSNIYIPNGQPASDYKCNIIKILYNNGDEVVSDTGGWTAGNNSTITSGAVTKYSDKIYFNCITDGTVNKIMFLACNNMIDTSKYSSLKVKAQITEMLESGYKPSLGFGLVTEKFDIGKWNMLYEITRIDSEPTVYELPISSNNAGYIEISGYIANGYFYEVWLLM